MFVKHYSPGSQGYCNYDFSMKCQKSTWKYTCPEFGESSISLLSVITRHVFVKHGCPRRQQSQNMAKISKSYILTQPHPQGHVMSVKCEEPIDELSVQVWSLHHHQNYKYCTLFVSGTELRTDKQTNRRTIRLLDAPGGPFRPGA